VDVVTAAVTTSSLRRETAVTPVVGGVMTSDDDVDDHMTKTDTCYTLLSTDDAATPDTPLFDGRF